MSTSKTCDTCGESFTEDPAIVREKNLKYEVQEHPNVCYSCLIENDLTFKTHMAMSFMESANLLEQRRDNVMPESTEQAKLKSEYPELQRKHVAHFLYAMVFEISIKIIYGIEKNKIAPPTHKLLDLYNDLSRDARRAIRSFYCTQVSHTNIRLPEFFSGKKTESGKTINIKLANLEEALELNEKVIRDFKYNAQLKGKSSVLGSLIWDEELQRQWTIPIPDLVIFPKSLLKYAISLKEARSSEIPDERTDSEKEKE